VKIVSFGVVTGADEEDEAAWSRVEKAFAGITALQLTFTGQRDGELTVARGGRVRLRLAPPIEELWVCDGANGWHHFTGAPHVRVEDEDAVPVCHMSSIFQRMPGKQRAKGELESESEYFFQTGPFFDKTYVALSVDLAKSTVSHFAFVEGDDLFNARVTASVRDPQLPKGFFEFAPMPGMVVNGSPKKVPVTK
jgi:hypothetical protein